MSNINPTRPNNLPVKIGAGVLVVIIFLAVVVYSKNQNVVETEPVANVQNSNSEVPTSTPAINTSTNTSKNTSTNTPTPTTNTNTPSTPKSPYKNGTYAAVGTYTAPSGKEEIAVSVTVANGKITNSTVTKQTENQTSTKFQNEFIAGYKQFVTGKDISTLKLTKVSGSSLTPGGFNNAIEQIKAQAAI